MKQRKSKIIPVLIWATLFMLFVNKCWLIGLKNDIINHINKQVIIEKVEQEPEYITVLVERELNTNYAALQLKVTNIEQNPELPTGCEVTSLTTVLRYLGYDIDKVTLSDLFLPKGEIGKTHPDEAFIGNPKDKSSYGANAPVIVNTANDYLSRAESRYTAYDLTGTQFPELIKYVNDGYPVIVWATMNMQAPYPTTKWNLDSGEYQWYARFHCMVLIGYTEDKYIMADPLQKDIVYYDKELVEKRYNELGTQAVVIY